MIIEKHMVAKKGPAPKVVNESTTASPTERAFNIIELVARAEAISIGEMISALGIPRPTVSRMVANLEAVGYLRKGDGRGRYVIGPRLVNVAEDILRATAAQAPCHAVLMELSRVVGESCSLGVMRGGEVVYLDSVSSNAPLTLQFLAGQVVPLHCTSSGQIFLADMPQHQLEDYLRTGPWAPYTPNSITEPKRLAELVEQIREKGYATNDSGFVMGVVGIAVPVLGTEDRLVACLSIASPEVRKSIVDLEGLLPELQMAANRISRAMFHS